MTSQLADGRGIPPEIAENFRDLFPDNTDFADFLQDQECVYQSFQNDSGRNIARASDSDHSGGSRNLSFQESHELSDSESMSSDLAVALSLSLMELENSFQNVSVSESEYSGIGAGDEGASSSETYAVAARSSNVDPDDMSYEQLQVLGDTIGVQSKGLSEELISSLPSKKFRGNSGFFSSKKSKYEECVICKMDFEKGEWLTTLSCKHQYHTKCINRWLGENNNCPVCKSEISGP